MKGFHWPFLRFSGAAFCGRGGGCARKRQSDRPRAFGVGASFALATGNLRSGTHRFRAERETEPVIVSIGHTKFRSP